MGFKIPEKVQVLGRDIQPDQLKYHDKRVLVSKELTFDSAHHLHNYEGKCKNMHGHTYRLQVIMSGRVDHRGISIDFGDIKRITKEAVIDRLDHKYLNEVLPPMNTTAENMVVWMYEEIKKQLQDEGLYPAIELEEVRLWETPTSFAAATKAFMEE